MSVVNKEEFIREFEEEKQRLSAPVLPPLPSSLSEADREAINNILLEDQEAKKQREGQALGLITELGGGLGASIATKSGARAAKAGQQAKYLLNFFRGAKATSVAGIAAPEPVSSVVGVAGFALTEAAIWGLSNYFAQQVRKSYGLQEATRASEVMTAAAFGIMAVPADKAARFVSGGVISYPLKLTNQILGKKTLGLKQKLVVKGSEIAVSGAVLGAAETALRQEVALQLNEEGATRDTIEYLYAVGVGAGLNSLFHILAKFGPQGVKIAKDLVTRSSKKQRALSDPISAEIKELQAKAKKLKGRQKYAVNARIHTLRQKKEDIELAADILEDFGDELNVATKETDKPAVVKEEPVIDLDVVETEAPVVKEKQEPNEAPVAEEKGETELLPEGFKEELEEFTGSDQYEELIISGDALADGIPKEEWPAFINAGTKIIARGHAFQENALRNFISGTNRTESLRGLLASINQEIRITQNVTGPLTKVAGSSVKGADIATTVTGRGSRYSIETMDKLEKLKNLQTLLKKTLDDPDLDDDFVEAAQGYLTTKDKLRKKQRQKAREEAKGEQVVNLETRVKELEEKLAEKKAVEAGKPAKQPKTAKEKAEAQLEKEQQDFVEGKQDEAPKKAANKEDAELQELRERIAFYKKNKKEAAEIEELEASIDRLSKLGKEGDPEKISKLVSSKPKWAGIKKVKSYLEDLRGVNQALRRELKKSLDPQKTPEKKFQDKIEAQKQKLQDRLTELQERAVGPKAKAADELVDAKPAKKEDTVEEGQTKIEFTDKDSAEVKDLRARIKSYDRFEKEAANYDAVVAEEQRLKDILKRGDADEMQQEVGRMPGRFKGTVQSKYDKAVKEVANRKKAMRTFLTKLAKQEERIIKAKKDYEFYKAYSELVESSIKEDKVNFGLKLYNKASMYRRSAMLYQPTTLQAAFPTAIFSAIRNLFRPIATRLYQNKEGLGKELAAIDFEEALGVFTSLFKSKERQRITKTFKRAFQELQDPDAKGYRPDLSLEGLNGDLPRGKMALLKKAEKDANIRKRAENRITNRLGDMLEMNKLDLLYSIPYRALIGIDAMSQSWIRPSRIRATIRKNTRLEFHKNPENFGNSIEKAQEVAEQRIKEATEDVDGLNIMQAVDDAADEADLITDDLLMVSSGDMARAEKKITDRISKSLSKITRLTDPTPLALATRIITDVLAPFFGVALKGTLKLASYGSGPFAGALRHSGGTFGRNVKRLNKQRENLKKQLNLAPEKELEIRRQINELDQQISINERRAILVKREALTDMIIGSTFAVSGLALGYFKGATGTLAWMSPEERKRSKEQPNTINIGGFKINISAAIPFNAINPAVDIGNYIRQVQEGKDPGKDWYTVLGQSFAFTARDIPVLGSIKNIEQVFLSEDVRKGQSLLADLFATFIPNLAGIRKPTELATRKGTINDPMAQDFKDRVFQKSFGLAAVNKKRDMFGDYEQSGQTNWDLLNRFKAKTFKPLEPIEEIIAQDRQGVITKINMPKSINGVDLYKYKRKSDGRNLQQLYADLFQTFEVKEQLNDFVLSDTFSSLADLKASTGDSERQKNLGLQEIQAILSSFHTDTEGLLLVAEDLDDYIDEETGMTAKEIFVQTGAITEEDVKIKIPSPINP